MSRKCKKCIGMLGIMMMCFMAGCKSEKDVVPPENMSTEAGDENLTQDVTVPEEIKQVEAPMLQAMVTGRQLPKLEERLPSTEDIAIESMDSVGTYCNDVQFAAVNADTMTGDLVSEGLFRYAADGSIVPNIAKAYETNGDFTQYTIHLRKGMRWSDGVPFTADDCIFFYEKMCLPETFGEPLWECFKVYDSFGMPGKAVFTKVDNDTFRITFPSSKPEFLPQLLKEGGICFAPEHYHVNLLPAYLGDDAAKAKAKEMGYKDVEAMLRETVIRAWNTPGIPTLNPFCISEEEGKNNVAGDYYEFERNPYYWKTDAEGRQLPYLDRLGFTRISDERQKILLTTEGFLSVSGLTAEQVEEAKTGTQRGQYRVITWTNFSSYAVKNTLQNFPESCPPEESLRGIGAAHVECWYMK